MAGYLVIFMSFCIFKESPIVFSKPFLKKQDKTNGYPWLDLFCHSALFGVFCFDRSQTVFNLCWCHFQYFFENVAEIV